MARLASPTGPGSAPGSRRATGIGSTPTAWWRWTGATLALIAANPRVAASRLAPRLGLETAPFKSNVRRLKALGLTISHDTGYTLTSLGVRVLREGAHERT